MNANQTSQMQADTRPVIFDGTPMELEKLRNPDRSRQNVEDMTQMQADTATFSVPVMVGVAGNPRNEL